MTNNMGQPPITEPRPASLKTDPANPYRLIGKIPATVTGILGNDVEEHQGILELWLSTNRIIITFVDGTTESYRRELK